MHAFDKENGSKCLQILDKSVHEKERLLPGRMSVRSSPPTTPSPTAKWCSDGFPQNRSYSRYNIVSPMNELRSARRGLGMGGIETERDLSLDSTFFVAFDLTHRALKSGLAQASDLNVTQYRMLVKLLAARPDGVAQSSLGKLLDLKPNVVTQAMNALVAAGFATRSGDGADGRVRTARITEAGVGHVAGRTPPSSSACTRCSPPRTRSTAASSKRPSPPAPASTRRCPATRRRATPPRARSCRSSW